MTPDGEETWLVSVPTSLTLSDFETSGKWEHLLPPHPPPTHTHTRTHVFHDFAFPVLLTSYSFVFYFTLHKYQVNIHAPGIFLSPFTPNYTLGENLTFQKDWSSK